MMRAALASICRLSTLGAALAAGLLASCQTPPADMRAPADLIIVNANVKTMDPLNPVAEAVAIRDGRIVAVGRTSATGRLKGELTEVVDAGMLTVVPGFIDTHMHPSPAFDDMSRFGVLRVSADAGVRSRDAFNARLAAKASVTPAGQTIVARGYGDELIGGHPLAAELDAVVPNHPLIVVHSSGHRMVANTVALRLAGITRDTPDPPGGKFGRLASGEPDGIVLEAAQAMVGNAVAAHGPGEPAPADRLEAFRQEFRNFAAVGITGVADAGAGVEKLEIYRSLLGEGMTVSVYFMMQSGSLDWLIAHRKDPEWVIPGLTLRTVKLMAGNSFSGRTALLSEPYADDPHYRGLEPRMTAQQLTTLVQQAHEAGVQVAAHANGDVEIDRVLDAIEAAQRAAPGPSPRHRIEHASVMTAPILARAAALDVCLAPHSYILNHGEKLEAYGEKRFEWLEPNRRALDAGVCVGGNSDHGVSPPKVMERIESLVTRRAASNGKVYGASQRLSPDEALATYTIGSAYLQFEEDERGSIAVGKRADLVLLSADPAKVAPEAISDIEVQATYIGGKRVFDASRTGAERFSW